MPTDLLPDPETEYGRRVRARLSGEAVIWLTTVGVDGTPQPNPVWFFWQQPSSVLVYNRPDAKRLSHIARNPRVALHLDGNGHGGDIIVLAGDAAVADEPPPHEHPDYLGKYQASMIRVSGKAEQFSLEYPVAIRIDVTSIRGF
jgi:PPOX class probable F420-dependent enzyme